MIEAEISINEKKRLEALYDLTLLDSAPEQRFDRIVAIARELFNAPVVLISLIDEERQWFKSRCGTDESETTRDMSFCAHAVADDAPVIVENALEDERFHDNPLVTGEFGLRFYAGHPIHSPDGYPLGALCIIDKKPRTFSEDDKKLLQMLAGAVDDEIASPKTKDYFRDKRQGERFGAFMQTVGGRLSRKPVSLGLAASLFIALVLLLSVQSVRSLENTYLENQREVSNDLFSLRGRLETELNARLHMAHGLAGFVRASSENVDRTTFLSFAKDLGQSLTGIRSLQLAPDAVVRFIWPYETNSEALGHDLLADPDRREIANLAIQERELWVAGPLDLIQGGTGLIGRLPIFLPDADAANQVVRDSGGEQFWGFATVLIDVDTLLQEADFEYLAKKSAAAIRGRNGTGNSGTVFAGSKEVFDGQYLSAAIALPAGSWEVGVAVPPAPSWEGLSAVKWLLIAGVAFIISGVVYLMLRLPDRYLRAVETAKQDLANSNARFNDAIESLPDGFSVFDGNDRLVRCNKKYREFFSAENRPLPLGLSFDELLRDAINTGLYRVPEAGPDVDAKEAFFSARMAHHVAPTRAGLELELANGRWLRAVECRIPSGGTIIAYSDVSELKNKEYELANAKKKAEAANEAKTAFLATVSHELRTPLNAILGLLNLVQMSGRLQKADQEFIDVTNESAEHLLNLLNELLDLSKMESNKLELELSEFNLACVVGKTVKLSETKALQKKMSLTEDIATDARVTVMGDAGRLQQVLLNLISNSLKFSDAGTVTVSVKRKTSADGVEWFCFSVEDTGVGFSEAQAKTLFQPFSQLDSTAARKHEGTGLGLAICKRVIELMGGTISAHGQPGEGATFYFEIPLQICEASVEEEATEVTDTALPGIKRDRPVRVLIAEDSPANQIVFRAMLKDTEYYADIVGNGLEAVAAAREFDYDVVLMDIFMPEMDGLEATRTIRESGLLPSLPIIALTANAMAGDRKKFLDAGMDDYLAKPVDKRSLIAMLNRWTMEDA